MRRKNKNISTVVAMGKDGVAIDLSDVRKVEVGDFIIDTTGIPYKVWRCVQNDTHPVYAINQGDTRNPHTVIDDKTVLFDVDGCVVWNDVCKPSKVLLAKKSVQSKEVSEPVIKTDRSAAVADKVSTIMNEDLSRQALLQNSKTPVVLGGCPIPVIELSTVAPIKFYVTIGGAIPTLSSADTVQIGDFVIDRSVVPYKVWKCIDNTVGSTLYRLNDGDMISPSSAVDGDFPVFDGVSGHKLRNSSYNPDSFDVAGAALSAVSVHEAIFDHSHYDSVFSTMLESSGRWESVRASMEAGSGNWWSVFDAVWSSSGRWDSAFSNLNSLSGHWESTFSTVGSNSGNWNTGGTVVASHSGRWESVFTTVENSSGDWNNIESVVVDNSGKWESTYSTVQSQSGSWDGVVSTMATHSGRWESVSTVVEDSSANWNNVVTIVQVNSGDWNNVEAAVVGNSGNWDSTYSTVLSQSGLWGGGISIVAENSGKWESAFTTLEANSGDWNNIESAVVGNSGKWESVFTTVEGNSGDWTNATDSYMANSGRFVTLDTEQRITATKYIDADVHVNGRFFATSAVIITTEQLYLSSNFITLNSNSSGALSGEDAGIRIHRGAAVPAEIRWDGLNERWMGGLTGSLKEIAYTDIIDGVQTTVHSNSGKWESVFTTVENNSGDWNNIESVVVGNSGRWESAFSTLNANSGDWNNIEAAVVGNSGKWESVFSTVEGNSGNWNSVESSVLANSSDWNTAYAHSLITGNPHHTTAYDITSGVFISSVLPDPGPLLKGGVALPAAPSGLFYRDDGTWTIAGSGDIVGPSASTDNAIVRFDGITGKKIQDYTSGAPTISDTGFVTLTTGITSPATGSNNEMFGSNSISSTLTGGNNTALGKSVMAVATSAANCVGVGYQALNSLTGGGSNTAVGANSLKANTNGSNNSAFGINSLLGNITGIQNTSIGADSMRAVASTNNNTAVGYSALRATTGANNTAVGHSSLYAAIGSNNVGLGYYAGRYETGSNAFYVDNQDRTDTAGDKAKALLYGTFNADPVSQTLAVNASLTVKTTAAVGTSSVYGAVTVSGGASFTTIPGYNIASIGYIHNSATSWEGNGFLFTNATSGSRAFSMVMNVDKAWFGTMRDGYPNEVNMLMDLASNRVGFGSYAPQAQVHIASLNAGIPAIITEAASSQTANIQEWRANGGTVLSYVDKDGWFYTPSTAPTSDYQAANKKYVDDQLSGENLWDRVTGSTNYLQPHTSTDTIKIPSGELWCNTLRRADGVNTYGIDLTTDLNLYALQNCNIHINFNGSILSQNPAYTSKTTSWMKFQDWLGTGVGTTTMYEVDVHGGVIAGGGLIVNNRQSSYGDVTFNAWNTAPAGASWTRSGTTVTFSGYTHGLVPGDSITVTVSSDTGALPLGTYVIAYSNSTSFYVIGYNTGGTSGTATWTRLSTTAYSYSSAAATHTFNGAWLEMMGLSADRAYRFRTTGGALDWEFGGKDLYISGWTGATYWGAQKQYLIMRSGSDATVMRAATLDLSTTLTSTPDVRLTTTGVVFNYSALTRNFTINKLTSGTAYVYDATADTHTFHGTMYMLGHPTGLVSISTGTADNDKLVTKGYVDDIVGGENYWDRSGTLLTTHTSDDSVAIAATTVGAVNKFTVGANSTTDALAVTQLNTTAADRKPLVVQGYSSQTANLTEWQNNSGTALTYVAADGSLQANGHLAAQAYQDVASLAAESLTNSAFPSGLTGWVVQATATGTVSTSGTAVTGLGTNFQSCFGSGNDTIRINSVDYTIASVSSNTSLTLQSSAGTQSGVSWSVVGGWSWTSAGVVTHTAGNSFPLSQALGGLTVSTSYQSSTVFSSVTAGTVIITLGTSSGSVATGSSGTVATSFYTNGSALTLAITPTTTFSGQVNSSSLKRILVNANPALIIKNSDASVAFEARSGGSALYNIMIGTQAGQYLTTGNNNVALGHQSCSSLTTGTYNAAVGQATLISNTTGSYNSAMGSGALSTNGVGSYNSAYGSGALSNNTSGSNNAAVGYRAMRSNTNGPNNTAIGCYSVYSNIGGSANVGVGFNALFNTTGSNNTSIGSSALYTQVNVSNTVAIGYCAGKYNTASSVFYVDAFDRTDTAGDQAKALMYGQFHATTASSQTLAINGALTVGYRISSPMTGAGLYTEIYGATAGNFTMTGTGNTGLGYGVLKSVTGGVNNTALGYNALSATSSGNNNVGVGTNALQLNQGGFNNTAVGTLSIGVTTSGNNNAALGTSSLGACTTGSTNTAVGAGTLAAVTTTNGSVALGYMAGNRSNTSNSFFVGNVQQTNEANDQAYSLLWGTFSGSAASLTNQQLTINGTTTVRASADASKGLVVKRFSAGQTANIQEWQTSTGSTLAYVDKNGIFSTIDRNVYASTNANETIAQTMSLVEQTQSGITTTLWASPTTGDTLTIKNSSAGSNTVSGNGKNIDGSSTLTLAAGDSVTLAYNGTQWLIFSIGNTSSFVEQWVSAPASATSAGIKGQLAWDSTYLYVCIATGGAGSATWIRAAQERSW